MQRMCEKLLAGNFFLPSQPAKLSLGRLIKRISHRSVCLSSTLTPDAGIASMNVAKLFAIVTRKGVQIAVSACMSDGFSGERDE